jgi:hypothetical protein
MRHRSHALVHVAAGVALAGCAARSSTLDALNATTPQEYRGHYTTAPGSSWFQRCGAPTSEPAWWVTVTGVAVAQVDSARRAGLLVDGQRTFVHWRAVLTRGGEVGPSGSTALLVREVLAVRPAAAGDCAAP